MGKSKQISDERITPKELEEKGVHYVLEKIRKTDGYFITNAERDISQSDFRNRILLHTQLLVSEQINNAGYFSIEISGGASIHVDLLRKQVNPLEKLQVLRESIPDTLFQTVCRGINLFGYRPYPENVIRLTVQNFSRYIHVWRVFDFLNYIPNMIPVFEEVQAAGRILEPAICFSTGEHHTDEFYVKKVGEILDITGLDVILGIKNHSGLGTSKRIDSLVTAILNKYPDLIIHYHGHNTDGGDIGRIVGAVRSGVKIVDAGDHAFTGYYGPPPIMTVVEVLVEYGFHAAGLDRDAVIETSNVLRPERKYYRDCESTSFGFDSTVQIHKLPGGGLGWYLEQAVRGGFLKLAPEIMQKELPMVHKELGGWWAVAPGSQILWTTAVNNVLQRVRYQNVTDDLKNLLLGRYGDFPFYRPDDDIYEVVFGPDWRNIYIKESGYQKIDDINIDIEKDALEYHLGRPATEDELVLYLQHQLAAVDFFNFEKKYGKTWVLPPKVWYKKGGFDLGETFEFPDAHGKLHSVEIGPKRETEKGDIVTYFVIDHHHETILTELDQQYRKRIMA
jgi:pyruvate carboxylase